MPKNATTIHLSDAERSHLQSTIKKGTVEARVYRRAKILLLKSEGLTYEAIAEKLDITIPTVRLCIEKYEKDGMDAALGMVANNDFSGPAVLRFGQIWENMARNKASTIIDFVPKFPIKTIHIISAVCSRFHLHF